MGRALQSHYNTVPPSWPDAHAAHACTHTLSLISGKRPRRAETMAAWATA